jgi:outer membrane protein TolC
MRKNFLAPGIAFASLALASWSVAGEGVTTTRHKSWTEYSESAESRSFTLDRAILTALQQNPDILRAIQEIERSKGVILQIRAEALPHINAQSTLSWTDPNLGSSGFSSSGTGSTPSPGLSAGGGTGAQPLVQSPASQVKGDAPALKAASTATSGLKQTDTSYNIRIIGQQLVFNYSTFRSIRGTFFQRDAAYFAFRNVLDQTIATVKTQFYQVVVNKALIGVQEEQVQLLESQLKDQQNRFEAGTVPRFNVLQAQVALSNQIPNLISARNNYRISKLQLAKTLGLDFDPRRGDSSPLEVIGEMPYNPRDISIIEAIELGKQKRPFLKQARANVYNQVEQVQSALGGFFPTVSSSGGYEVFSSPFSTNFNDVSKGWVFGLTGNWAIFDSGATYGQVKQQRALLSEARITYDDDARQVELEIQQAYSNLIQNKELIQSQEKNVEQAMEAVRLAKARLDAGAGTQLDVLNAQVQLATAESTKLQALFGYNSSLAEFDRVTGAQSTYTESFDGMKPPAADRKIYDTSGERNAVGDRKKPAR